MRYIIETIGPALLIVAAFCCANEAGDGYSHAIEDQALYGPEIAARWYSITSMYAAGFLFCWLIASIWTVKNLWTVLSKED